MTPTEKADLQISEEQDGSVLVQIPDAPGQQQQSQESSADDAQDDAQDDAPATPPADGDENDEEREAIREARREERRLKKQIHREKARESNHLITALKKQNAELSDRLASLEQRTSGAELARVDKAIDDASVQVEYAKMKLKEAVSSRDGDGVTKAQEMWYEAQRRLESLQTVKQNATKQMSQPKQQIAVPDPSVQRLAAGWMSRNSWYDPQGADTDSALAQTLDRKLTEEGFDPATEEYWDELDDRIQKYIPHRAKTGYNRSNQSKPRSIVTSSSKDGVASSRPNEFRLSPERVAAIKESGNWDDPEKRAKMIRRYAEFDRQQKRG